MLSLARNGYSASAVDLALRPVRGTRTIDFRYDLLTSGDVLKAALQNVVADTCTITHVNANQIKRTLRISVEDDGAIDFLSDRIKPWFRLQMPDGGWVEFPLGVFLLSTPGRKEGAAGVITRDIQGYDKLQILVDDKTTDRYSVTSGTAYTTAVATLLTGAGIPTAQQNIATSATTLPATREWNPATTKLDIINNLLYAINYDAIWFDANGIAQVQPYISPATRSPTYTYSDDQQSVTLPGVEQQIDFFNVPNVVKLVVSQPDRATISATYTNSNPLSPVSTVSRGRSITRYSETQDASDSTTLAAVAARIAFDAAQVYEIVPFSTLIMPMHELGDVLTLNYSKLGIAANYHEQSWQFQCKAGAVMQHSVRRVLAV